MSNSYNELSTQASNIFNIGDYVQLGRYYDEPILWRCVDIDENGPLMLTDKILTCKSFDADGNHTYLDGTAQPDNSDKYRVCHGSNIWETSNIRSWLNSTATAGNVTWFDGCSPTADKVPYGYNVYDNERGFLAEGNFTASQRNVINTVTQKSLLNELDANKLKIGGTVEHKNSLSVSDIVQNYSTAYYHNVTDNIFLLDVKQLNYVYQNSLILGKNYFRGKPTQNAVENSDHDERELSSANYWCSWTRTPFTDDISPDGVRYVNMDGRVDYTLAHGNTVGVRPAFYIDLSAIILKSGDGRESTPYEAI